MDEMEFTEAESNLNDLVAEYQQYQVKKVLLKIQRKNMVNMVRNHSTEIGSTVASLLRKTEKNIKLEN